MSIQTHQYKQSGTLLIPLHHKIEKLIIDRLVKKNKKIHLQAARKIVEAADKSAQTSDTDSDSSI